MTFTRQTIVRVAALFVFSAIAHAAAAQTTDQLAPHRVKLEPVEFKGKRAILVLSRGGVYTKGPMLPLEFQESYLRSVLGFLGIDDVRVIHIEGVAFGADVAEAAVNRALVAAANVMERNLVDQPLAA